MVCSVSRLIVPNGGRFFSIVEVIVASVADVSTDPAYAFDDAGLADLYRKARKALRNRLFALAEERAYLMWGRRDDVSLSLHDRGLAGHHATTLLRAVSAGRQYDGEGVTA